MIRYKNSLQAQICVLLWRNGFIEDRSVGAPLDWIHRNFPEKTELQIIKALQHVCKDYGRGKKVAILLKKPRLYAVTCQFSDFMERSKSAAPTATPAAPVKAAPTALDVKAAPAALDVKAAPAALDVEPEKPKSEKQTQDQKLEALQRKKEKLLEQIKALQIQQVETEIQQLELEFSAKLSAASRQNLIK